MCDKYHIGFKKHSQGQNMTNNMPVELKKAITSVTHF